MLGFFVAYTMAKYGMSMCVLGMAEEFRGQIAVNALWPRTGWWLNVSMLACFSLTHEPNSAVMCVLLQQRSRQQRWTCWAETA